MSEPQIIEADWTWVTAPLGEHTRPGGRFEPDVQIVVGDDGRIEHVGAIDARPTHRLHHRALLPGFVNSHSHAFQRGLRGRAETFPRDGGSFWTWREEMYSLAESLDATSFYTCSRNAFREMLAAGITTVGEFHYLHHDATGDGYHFDDLLLDAARDAGIRLVLLNTYYRTGGFGKAVQGAQRRFHTRTLEEFWGRMDALAGRLTSRQTLDVAVHSLRAVPMDEVLALHTEAARRGMVLHIHLEEQAAEVDESMATYGRRPLRMLLEADIIGPGFTAVHCTHSDPQDLDRLSAAGGNVCLCPLTEANLGDGIPDGQRMWERGASICVGTDSNSRLCMTEELRWLEYGQRLRQQRRGVCVDDSGRTSRALLQIGTVNGARALGVETGAVEAGRWADFMALDLSAAALAGWTPETLLDAFLLGTGNEVVAAVCVGGHWSPIHGGPDAAHALTF